MRCFEKGGGPGRNARATVVGLVWVLPGLKPRLRDLGPGRNARATVVGRGVVDGRFDLPAAGV